MLRVRSTTRALYLPLAAAAALAATRSPKSFSAGSNPPPAQGQSLPYSAPPRSLDSLDFPPKVPATSSAQPTTTASTERSKTLPLVTAPIAMALAFFGMTGFLFHGIRNLPERVSPKTFRQFSRIFGSHKFFPLNVVPWSIGAISNTALFFAAIAQTNPNPSGILLSGTFALLSVVGVLVAVSSSRYSTPSPHRAPSLGGQLLEIYRKTSPWERLCLGLGLMGTVAATRAMFLPSNLHALTLFSSSITWGQLAGLIGNSIILVANIPFIQDAWRVSSLDAVKAGKKPASLRIQSYFTLANLVPLMSVGVSGFSNLLTTGAVDHLRTLVSCFIFFSVTASHIRHHYNSRAQRQ